MKGTYRRTNSNSILVSCAKYQQIVTELWKRTRDALSKFQSFHVLCENKPNFIQSTVFSGSHQVAQRYRSGR